jgi:hypothetical protein
MTRVWIAQCLCPSRHAILAASAEANGPREAEQNAMTPLKENIIAMLADRVINPWCAICHAKAETWRYDLGRTRFRTMEEAAPHLRQNEREQAVTRAVFGDIPRSD